MLKQAISKGVNMLLLSMNLRNWWFEYCHFNKYFIFDTSTYWCLCYEL